MFLLMVKNMEKRESETVEFKKSTSELKEGIISLCSMLNKHKKGFLYFGWREGILKSYL